MKTGKLFWIAAFIVLLGLGAYASFIAVSVPSDAKTAMAEASPAPGAGKVDVKAALADRALGDPSAKIRIDEYASLSCSHCADFSMHSFPKFKETYIDTGKVYFVYHDFPLNAPALDAAVIARCLPEERYFQFVKFLFETQDKWLGKDYQDALRQNSKLLGMDDATFDACLGSGELKQGLIDQMQKAGKEHEIQSTPSFVVNRKEVLHGALPVEAFEKVFKPLLAN